MHRGRACFGVTAGYDSRIGGGDDEASPSPLGDGYPQDNPVFAVVSLGAAPINEVRVSAEGWLARLPQTVAP